MKQHVVLGRKLKRIEDDLHHVSREIIHISPKAERAINKLRRIHELLNVVQCNLEARMFDEHGDDGAFTIYFGRRKSTGNK